MKFFKLFKFIFLIVGGIFNLVFDLSVLVVFECVLVKEFFLIDFFKIEWGLGFVFFFKWFRDNFLVFLIDRMMFFCL